MEKLKIENCDLTKYQAVLLGKFILANDSDKVEVIKMKDFIRSKCRYYHDFKFAIDEITKEFITLKDKFDLNNMSGYFYRK